MSSGRLVFFFCKQCICNFQLDSFIYIFHHTWKHANEYTARIWIPCTVIIWRRETRLDGGWRGQGQARRGKLATARFYFHHFEFVCFAIFFLSALLFSYRELLKISTQHLFFSLFLVGYDDDAAVAASAILPTLPSCEPIHMYLDLHMNGIPLTPCAVYDQTYRDKPLHTK